MIRARLATFAILANAATSVTHAHAAEPAPDTEASDPSEVAEVTPSAVRVDVDALGPGYERLQGRVADEADRLARESGVAPARVEVRLEWLDPDSFSYIVRAVIRPMREDGERLTDQEDCRQCKTEDVVATVETVVARALERAKQRDRRVAAAPGDPKPEPPQPRPADTPPADRRLASRSALGPMGWGGVSLLAAGTIAVSMGVAFVVIDERTPRERPIYIRDYQPPGIALLATGGAALITGGVLLGLDLRRNSKTTAGVHVDRETAMILLSGTF